MDVGESSRYWTTYKNSANISSENTGVPNNTIALFNKGIQQYIE